ncbi:hypothetical protein SAMN05877809_102340 [Rhodobacter sp. JA431]|uniref:hypothetical protein n=1 Tax=Rhodobacter sp. JA431 TaxID=570013 RepID=UPI000BC96186|nr:hypothetical protein [Rhodobacter sp. JA431]SOB98820.1 hypothetical protein SAMN05877809_102340 [Rhodobacter sp. JA431]
MKRRDFFFSAPALALAPLGALALASPAIAQTMTREEQIEHHKAELFRLYAETVPEGTVLRSLMMDCEPGTRQFVSMIASGADQHWQNDPFWHFSTLENEWEYCEVRA